MKETRMKMKNNFAIIFTALIAWAAAGSNETQMTPESPSPASSLLPTTSPTERTNSSTISSTTQYPYVTPPPPTTEDCSLAKKNSFPRQCGRFSATTAAGATTSTGANTASKSRRNVGGKQASRGQIPWQAQLDTGCGATIIGKRHLLTAAHCIPGVANIIGQRVHAGHILSARFAEFPDLTDDDIECTRQTRRVVDAHPHPCYCSHNNSIDDCGHWYYSKGVGDLFKKNQYDVAVLTVDSPFAFDKFVQPACLPRLNENVALGTMALISGFGRLPYKGSSATVLQYTWTPIVSDEICRKNLSSDITEDMICAGYPGDGMGPCNGDSGGPMVVMNRGNRAVLTGVVSWGRGCAKARAPAVYARVANFVDWVRKVVFDAVDGGGVNGGGNSGDVDSSSTDSFVKFDEGKCYKHLLPPPPSDEECVLASPNASNPFLGQCGRYSKTRLGDSRRRLINVDDVGRGRIPWQVQIDGCGAVIIDELHVLTAAHCIGGIKRTIGQPVLAGHIVSGSFRRIREIINGSIECTRQLRRVAQVLRHPCYCHPYNSESACGYSDSKGTGRLVKRFQYDMAILKVDRPFDFNEFVQPVCLPEKDVEICPATMAMTSGFGRYHYKEGSPVTLRKVWTRIVSNEECQAYHSSYNSFITHDMICTGVPRGFIGSCKGDTGGPMVVTDDSGRAVLAGIVSWGRACAAPGSPPVYAKVSYFVNWIRNAISEGKWDKIKVNSGEFIKFDDSKCNNYMLNRPNATTTSVPTTFCPFFPPPPSESDCRLAAANASNPFPGQCGRYNESRKDEPSRLRIVGGRDAARGFIPWQAQIVGCGATIVGDRHLITAAHCINPARTIGQFVHAGHVRSAVYYDPTDRRTVCTRQTRRIIHVDVHPCYCDLVETNCGRLSAHGVGSLIKRLQYDVAVITVNESFAFNEFVQPACLPPAGKEIQDGTVSMASGFGLLEYGGSLPGWLQYVRVPTLSQRECFSINPHLVTDDMLCTKESGGGAGTCQGDSGGPLVVMNDDGDDDDGGDGQSATLIGISSWGIKGDCSKQRYPSVYANVTNFVDWIHEMMRLSQTEKSGSGSFSSESNFAEFNESQCYNYLLNRSLVNDITTKPTTTTTTTTSVASSATVTTTSDPAPITEMPTTTTTMTETSNGMSQTTSMQTTTITMAATTDNKTGCSLPFSLPFNLPFDIAGCSAGCSLKASVFNLAPLLILARF